MYRLIKRLLLAAVLVMPTISCTSVPPATKRANLVESARVPGDVPRPDPGEQRGEERCVVTLGAFVDRRRNDEEMGEINGRRVKSGNVAGWLRKAFETELERDTRMQVVGVAHDGRGVHIDAEILSVYVVGENNSLVANIVMRLDYSMPGNNFTPPELAYGSNSVNTTRGELPLHEVFEVALSDLVKNARDRLEHACRVAAEHHGQSARMQPVR